MGHPELLLRRALEIAETFLDGLPERRVGAVADVHRLRAAFGGPLPEVGEEPERVIAALAEAAEPGLMATAGPRYFGFVIGATQPSALAADWLASAWDQNAGLYATSPAAAVAEEAVAGWLLELLDLPRGASVGFTSGATMANFTGIAAGRSSVLRRVGWDVDARGLQGAPEVTVVASDESHVTIFASLRMLGLGSDRALRVPTDEQGRMKSDALESVLAGVDGPVIVCAQAGNVNTGAFDPLEEIARIAHARGAWLHVDGAIGLWARASAELTHLARGLELADSLTTDAHKGLNVPHDSGISIVADPAPHRAAMTLGAAYYVETSGEERDPYNWVPESSRRARGFPLWALFRALGRSGIAGMFERDCRLARRMAGRLAAEPGIRVLNDVVLNQVLVRFDDDDARTRDVVSRVQADGTCWLGGTTWHGSAAMRVSVSSWSTTEADIDRSADAIVRCARAARVAAV